MTETSRRFWVALNLFTVIVATFAFATDVAAGRTWWALAMAAIVLWCCTRPWFLTRRPR